jgi:hypothetical protein
MSPISGPDMVIIRVRRAKMPSPEDEDIESLYEEYLRDYLSKNFPDELDQLRLLPPLKGNERLINAVKFNVGEIVSRYRRRSMEDNDYAARIKECIDSAKSAAKALGQFGKLLMGMDRVHRGAILAAANEFAPDPFLEQSPSELYVALTRTSAMMDVLSAAITIGTGISVDKRRGRPPLGLVLPAFELIREWEFITAELTTGEPREFFETEGDITATERLDLRGDPDRLFGLKVKRVPTPRPLYKGETKDQEGQYMEHSSAFVGICLKMIKPDITRQQVITSIKNVVKQRANVRQIMEKAPSG